MSTITFGGLATGMDTSSIVESLMEIERLPLTRLEAKKTAQAERLAAFEEFDTMLETLRTSVSAMSLTSQVQQTKVTSSNDSYFSATSTNATPGSYKVEVIEMAQVGKQIFTGYASKSEHSLSTGSLTLTVNGTDYDFTVDSDNNSLEDLASTINGLDAGVTASVMFDGDNYRLTLTGDEVSNEFSLTGAGIGDPEFSESPSRAHVTIDGVDVYCDTNTITGAVPNLTFDLTQIQEEPRTAVTVTVGYDSSGVKDKILSFVDAYNEVMTFISDGYSSTSDDEESTSSQILRGESSVTSVKRRLQSLLTASVSTAGSYQSLADLGISTERDGTLTLDSTTLDAALLADFESVSKVLVGDDSSTGVMKPFKTYMLSATSYLDGVYATAEDSIERITESLDSQIDRIETRLEAREESILAQFTALETLVSSMNSTSDYLTAQTESWNNLWS